MRTTPVATHFHYTVDVIVGFAFSVLVWHFYHQMVLLSLENGGSMNCMERVLSWLEAGAEDVCALKKELDEFVHKNVGDDDDEDEDERNRSISIFMTRAKSRTSTHNPIWRVGSGNSMAPTPRDHDGVPV